MIESAGLPGMATSETTAIAFSCHTNSDCIDPRVTAAPDSCGKKASFPPNQIVLDMV